MFWQLAGKCQLQSGKGLKRLTPARLWGDTVARVTGTPGRTRGRVTHTLRFDPRPAQRQQIIHSSGKVSFVLTKLSFPSMSNGLVQTTVYEFIRSFDSLQVFFSSFMIMIQIFSM